MTDVLPANAPPWLAKAYSYLGFHEQPNNRGIQEFINLAHCGSIGDPWCAIFTNACLEASGYRGTRSALARSFERDANFTKLDRPVVGCIVTEWRGSIASGSGHVFMCFGVTAGGIIRGLGGNQKDQVCIEDYSSTDSHITGFWWPKTAIAPTTSPAVGATFPNSGRGSWYSQNPPDWIDHGDKPNSNALGVADSCQGISFYDHGTLGTWFEVQAPNGKASIEQQTDIGPAPSTGRQIDISAVAAVRFGYTPHNFPTDGVFKWRPIPTPVAVASLSKKAQAAAYLAFRKDGTVTDTPPTGTDVAPVQPTFDLNQIVANIQQHSENVRVPLEFAVTLFNRLHPDKPLAGTVPAAPVAPAPPAAPATTPTLQRPSVQLGILGLIGSLAMQALGIMDPPAIPFLNLAGSTTGTLSTLLSAGTALFGGAGGFQSIANIIKALPNIKLQPKQ